MRSRFDASGWAVDPVVPLGRAGAYTLFTADTSARFDERLLMPKASSLLGLSLRIEPQKRFVHGAIPNADIATIELEGEGLPLSTVEVSILPVERAHALKTYALAVGSMGMETLVARSRRVLQVSTAVASGDPRASLACATLFAGVFLAAVLPPDEEILFGLKGGKERLEKVGIGG